MVRGDTAAALALYEESLPIAERLEALDETNVRAQQDLAWTRDRIAEARAMPTQQIVLRYILALTSPAMRPAISRMLGLGASR